MTQPSVLISDRYISAKAVATLSLPVFPGNNGQLDGVPVDLFRTIQQDIYITRLSVTFDQRNGNFMVFFIQPKTQPLSVGPYSIAIAPVGIGIRYAGEYVPNVPLYLPKDQTLIAIADIEAASAFHVVTRVEYYVDSSTSSQSSVIPRADTADFF